MTAEKRAQSGNDGAAIDFADEVDIRDHFAKNGFAWGVGDILVAGGSLRFLGELLACVLNVHDTDGRRAVRRIVSIQPADPDGGQALPSAIGEAIGRWRGKMPTPEEEGILVRAVKVVVPAAMTVESVLAVLREIEPQSAVVIRSASSYRTAGLRGQQKKDPLALPEDIWAPHLHALCLNSLAAVRDREVYLAIDAGEEWPHRQANRDLLLSVEGLGVLGGSVPEGLSALIAARLDAWNAALRTGELGPVLREVDALPSRFGIFKPSLRMRLLKKAGLDGLARQALEAVPIELARNHAGEALLVAEMAVDLDTDDLAVRLLREIAPGNLSPEFLETYLRLADRLEAFDLASQAESLLAANYPDSAGLGAYRTGKALAKFEFRAAADSCIAAARQELAAVYGSLAEALAGGVPDYAAASDAARGFAPAHRLVATKLTVDHALRSGRNKVALSVALAEVKAGEADKGLARLILRAINAASLPGSAEELLSSDVFTNAVSFVLEVVARTPANGKLRIELARTLATESMGLYGLATLLSITLDLARKPHKAESVPQFVSWAKPASEEEIMAYLRPAMGWMAQSSPVMIGRITLPDALVPRPADPVIMGLVHFLQGFNPIETESGVETLIQLLGCAMALAPHGSIKDMDINMLRLVAVRMALAGRHQKARDFAETALLLAGDEPRRARAAWHCQGDVYARSNNLHEALIAAACGMMVGGSATPDQIWYESMLLFRIARDLRMADRALAFLEAGRQALEEFGALEKYKCQLDTSALQLRVLQLSENGPVDTAALPALMADLAENARVVLSGDNEIAPVAVLLGQVVREAGLAGLDVPRQALDLLAELAERCDPSLRQTLAAASKAVPTALDAVALIRALDPAQHSEDMAFDVRQLVVVARRLLSGEEALANPGIAAFAVELLSDLAIAPPRIGGSQVSWLPKGIGVPSAQAARLAATSSVPVVFMGLDSNEALLRVTIEADGESLPVREPDAVFSRDRLHAWVPEFPYRYGIDVDSFNLFHTSTEGLGVSDLPARAAIIASTVLQRIPPNILRVGEAFAGDDRRLFVAPSMAWLDAARGRPAGDGRSAAWISTAPGSDGGQTLQTIADRLRDCLADHQIELDEEAAIPTRLAGADLAIVAAHGGLLPGNFYFHVIANDAALKAAARHLADAVRGVGVAVLFVCSGGRVDGHPMASTTVGLVKYALEAGCNTVVASPWPLDSRVPSYWLPVFLDAWKRGLPVVDAAFEANQTVKRQFSSEHRDYLAMNVYGDGLRIRSAYPAAPQVR
jgi:hypothetical protein